MNTFVRFCGPQVHKCLLLIFYLYIIFQVGSRGGPQPILLMSDRKLGPPGEKYEFNPKNCTQCRRRPSRPAEVLSEFKLWEGTLSTLHLRDQGYDPSHMGASIKQTFHCISTTRLQSSLLSHPTQSCCWCVITRNEASAR